MFSLQKMWCGSLVKRSGSSSSICIVAQTSEQDGILPLSVSMVCILYCTLAIKFSRNRVAISRVHFLCSST